MMNGKLKSSGLTIVTAIVVAFLLCVASIRLVKHSAEIISFDFKIISDLKVLNPDIVLVGSSVLGSNVIRKELTRALSEAAKRPVKVSYIWNGSIQTGFHYLALKNVIAPTVPEGTPVVFVSYEDWFVRPIDARMSEPHIARRYRLLMSKDEPVFLAKIGYLADHFSGSSPQLLRSANIAKRNFISSIVSAILVNSKRLGQNDMKLLQRSPAQLIERSLSRTFSLATFRNTNEFKLSAPRATPGEGDSPRPNPSDFPQVISNSFLPDIAEFSSRFKLYLVESPSNPSSIEAVKAARIISEPVKNFAEANGMKFIDLNGTPEISDASLYSDSRHFKQGKSRLMYSRVFAKKLVEAGILDDLKQ